MVKKINIAVVTSARSEYGLLYWLLRRLKNDKDCNLQLIATGAHLSHEFGHTVDEIRKDGFDIAASVDILLSGDSPVCMAKSTGLGISSFSDVFTDLRTDILVVLGDRFEIFSAAYAAKVLNIPIVHISGGDTTEGAIDDVLRHSISLMGAVHFVKLEKHKNKLLRLGIKEGDIFHTGYLGLERIARLKMLSKAEIEKRLNARLGSPLALMTFHPVTNPKNSYDNKIENLLDAVSGFKDMYCVFTAANEDSGGRKINAAIKKYCLVHKGRSVFVDNLGQQMYISMMSKCDLLIGNSSSGILESGFLKVPAVNILPRQLGREKNENVIDCRNIRTEIIDSVNLALSREFRSRCKEAGNIYEGTHAKNISETILKTIKDRLFHGRK